MLQENWGGQPRNVRIIHYLPYLVHIHIAETVGRTAKNVRGIILFAESYTAKNDWSWDAAENLEVDQWRNLCLDVGLGSVPLLHYYLSTQHSTS